MGNRLDILIREADIYDGSGRPPFRASVGIKGETIVTIGDEGDSARVIDAAGLALCPGFIDTHGHSEFTVIAAPSCDSKVLQGVTTEINGNCGLSAAPLLGEARRRREADFREVSVRERWTTFAGFFTLLDRKRPALNFATLAGHGNIRGSVVGYRDAAATREELAGMVGLLEGAFRKGAVGVSTGLIYPPGVFTSAEELISLIRQAARGRDLIYATHMRSEGDRLIEAIRETLRIGRTSGIRTHISHLKTAGPQNWHKIDEALRLIEAASEEGLAVTFDRYPYTASSTDLDTILPSWVYEGGNEQQCRRLRDPADRGRVIEFLKVHHPDPEYYRTVLIASVTRQEHAWMEGMDVLSIARRTGHSPEVTVLDLLVKERLRVGAIFISMSEDNLRRFLTHPLCMIGSDSAVRSFQGATATGRPHPRAFGTFPRFLGRYVIKERLMSLEEGIRKVTSFPAATFRLAGRGQVREGYKADLVVFDPRELMDTATYQEPFSRPKGIAHVLVNGREVVSRGEMVTGVRPGAVLRH